MSTIQVSRYGLLTLLFSIILSTSVVSCKKSTGPSDTGVIDEPPPLPPQVPALSTVRSWLVDKNATEETAALFYNLQKVAKTNILFGHQDDTKRGVINASAQWANEQHLPPVAREKSDVKDVTGAYPAVYGHDFLHIANFENGNWYDYEAKIARELTIDAYNRGGVNTYAWHYNNPVSKGNFYWDQSPVEAVRHILPGGSHHAVFRASLKEVADFAKALLGAEGKLVPVIFRPFHEFDGDWFWWGNAHATANDYKAMFQFTVTYLRDSLGVRNFLYGWSPDRIFNTEAEFTERYPGDAYVDLVGCDNYWDLRAGTAPTIAANKLKIVSDFAKNRNKLAALTETGLQNITRSDWFTQQLQKALQANTLELAYVLLWANTKDAFWTPFKGHPSEPDFIRFRNEPYIMFGDEAPAMYRLK